jgi:phytoene desaturase
MYSLIQAMERLAAELGVTFHTNSPVEEVVVSKGRAQGVRVSGEEIGADAVLVGADLPYAYRELLGGTVDADFKFRKREKLEYTASAFMLYLGIDRKLEHLLHHNFYLSDRYRENFEAIFSDRRLPEVPSFYAVVPSRTEPRLAPAGKQPSRSSCRCPHLGPNVDWEREAPRSRRRSTGCFERRCGLDRSRCRSTRRSRRSRTTGGTTTTWRRGRRSGSATASPGRVLPPADGLRSVGGMYFVGASTRPGRGVRSSTIGCQAGAERQSAARGRGLVRLDPASGVKL